MAIAFSGIGKTLMGSPVIFSGNNAKVLKNNLDLNGVTTILTGPLDPTQTATAGNKGSMYLSTLTGLIYTKKDSGSTTNWSAPASGQKNYFESSNANPNFENHSVSPWIPVSTTFTNGAPGTLALNSGSMALSINAGAPLSGSFDLAVTKPAVNAQGSGFASGVLTVAREDSAKMLFGSFSFASNSTNLDASGSSTQSLEIWIYDVTNNAWIQPTGYRGMNQNVGAGKCTFSFQTPYFAVTNQFRVCIFTAQTSTLSYAVEFDNFVLGPQTILTGAVVTDWQSFTPVISGFGTVSNLNGKLRSNGDTYDFQVFFTSGTPAATLGKIGLPVTINNASLAFSTYYNILGDAAINGGGANAFIPISETVNANYIYIGLQNSGNNGLTPLNGNSLLVSGQSISLKFSAPIFGKSSNTQMSSDSDQRVIKTSVSTSGSTSLSANTATKIIFATVGVDKSGSFSNSRYNVTSSGSFTITPNLQFIIGAGNSVQVFLYKNGTQLNSVTYGSPGGNVTACTPTFDDEAVAGDYYEIWGQTGVASTVAGFCTFKKMGNPASILGTEKCSMKYTGTGGAVAANAVIPFPTSVEDTHNAWNGTQFKVPYPGTLGVSLTTQTSSVAGTNYISKNGSAASTANYLMTNNAGVASASNTIPVLAGDLISINSDSAVTFAGIMRVSMWIIK